VLELGRIAMLGSKSQRPLDWSSGVAVALGAALICGLAQQPSQAEEVDWSARAKQTWHDTCQPCHVATDTSFETDRAFLRQIIETS
jgi:hypothetical protein